MKSTVVKFLYILLVVSSIMCLCACEKDTDPSKNTNAPVKPTNAPQESTGTSAGEITPSDDWVVIPGEYLIFEMNDEGTGYKCLGFREQREWADPQYVEKYPYCVIPSTFNGLPVLQISGGWGWKVAIKGISVPDSVTSLRFQVFSGMESLESAKLPSSITEFGDGIFMNCVNLKEVTLGDGLQYFGGQCFQGCTSLKRITLPGSLLSISMREFADCSALEEIILPEGLTNIARDAFANCSSLESLTIPSTVKSIGSGAFNGCAALKEITFQGTTEQWYELNSAGVPSGCVVHCADGEA